MERWRCLARRGLHAECAVAVAVAVAAVSPLLAFDLVPAVDLPAHLAIAKVLATLIGDGSAYYAFNPQPVPYHLVYVLLTPLVALLGPLLAARVFEAAVVIATVMSLELLRRAVGKPRWVLLPAVAIVHETCLYWGWVGSQLAIPIVVAGIACLVAGRIRCAAVCSLLLGTVHVAMVVPWLAWIGALALADRARQRVAVTVGMLCLLPVLPTFFLKTELAGSIIQRFRPKTAVHYAAYQMRIFDNELGRNCKWAVLILVLVGIGWGVWRSQGWLRSNRFALVAAAMALFAYVAVPLDLGSVWGVNIRYLFFFGVALILLLPQALPRPWFVALGVALASYGWATYSFWSTFETVASPAVALARAAPPGGALTVKDPKRRTGTAWAPVELHLHAYYLAHHGAFDEAVFAGAHLPIRDRQPRPPNDLLWLGDPEAKPPAGATLLDQQGRWRLFKMPIEAQR